MTFLFEMEVCQHREICSIAICCSVIVEAKQGTAHKTEIDKLKNNVIMNLRNIKHHPNIQKGVEMNYYIEAQIFNIKSMVKVFKQSCEIAAQKDNGHINKEEEKQLKQIKAAAEKFCKELDKIK